LRVSYTELGFLMTIFFVVSCAVQAASGFLVDRFGPRPILFGGWRCWPGAPSVSRQPNYATMMLCVVVAGTGNGVFHPADYTLINRKVTPRRLGHAYSVHGITGSLGWALAPALVVPLAIAFHWRVALAAGGCVALAVLAVLWVRRAALELPPAAPAAPAASAASAARAEGSFDFLRIPAVWMCFSFFFVYAGVLSGVQAYAPEAPASCTRCRWPCWPPASRRTWSAARPAWCWAASWRPTRRAASASSAPASASPPRSRWRSAAGVPALAVPVLFGAMGFASRHRRAFARPAGEALHAAQRHRARLRRGLLRAGHRPGAAPLVFGALMDHQHYQGVWLGLVLLQCC
jgi:MFS family permease